MYHIYMHINRYIKRKSVTLLIHFLHSKCPNKQAIPFKSINSKWKVIAMDEDFLAFSKVDEEKDFEDGNEDRAPALLTSTPAPWLAYSFQHDKKAPPFVRLHNEILTLCEYIAPSVHEMNQRDALLIEVTEIIHSLWPKSTVSVFGSQMTKILTPTSDLDILVMNVPETKHDPLEMYNTLAEKLKDSSLVSYVEAITNAKVPIVKFDHRKSGISVDICINNDSGVRTGKLIRKFVREYPPLRPLVLVLKMFLVGFSLDILIYFHRLSYYLFLLLITQAQRKMNETYSGGIGSFVLTLMIVSFLQMKQRNCALSSMSQQINAGLLEIGVSPNKGDTQNKTASLPVPSWNLGTLLLEFLQLYGMSFNYFSAGISITEGGSYLVKRKRCKIEGNMNRYHFLSFVRVCANVNYSTTRSLPHLNCAITRNVRVLTCIFIHFHSCFFPLCHRPNMLYLENPDLPDLDIGRNSYMMPKIRRSFEHAHQLLTNALGM